MQFTKGHGTQNDFVVLPDPDALLDLTVRRVATLCDRPAGIGADGVLRVARSGALVERGILDALPDGVSSDDWFMDYRNGDGSIAEMCGNGVRVFSHYVRASGLVTSDRFVVGSRAGGKPAVVHSHDATDAEVTVEMGAVRVFESSEAVVGERTFTGLGVDVGNPHLVCVSADLEGDALGSLDLSRQPGFDEAVYPHGVNIEFVTVPKDGHVSMRVHERGVGETRSCGTGIVAAAVAALRHDGSGDGELTVHVPGGTVSVRVSDGAAWMRGPSVLVASGEISDSWWVGLEQ
ncbi:diaminopimelate epimerase [Rhodococcus sp. Leaf7]|uniref:diaminopimelate epimerase n=1 Tax=unclassified Rhodococcus (in: high G+C Gram-positive bacteria) TaxID=192944 RepID=UPI0007014FED|nr:MULTISPECIES: diaminopimelate epimerase [unclassified Rhodococcus (in: high G+C Gram-positive bacteria)]KQU02854.1 diaminopimelate epimerase [Rhodococcus sp. Leaf7]KQU38653.1 diaminopimelate epimerase [Rhodococcus sp. Leaf247]